MFDTALLCKVIEETTTVFRKGQALTEEDQGGIRVIQAFGYPHVNEARDLEMVDCHYVTVGVNMLAAERNQADLIEALLTYPEPERLAGGPSYIEVGAEIGSQEYAFRLFALGKALHMWDVLTPAAFGIEGAEADDLAGKGMIMMSGWK